MLFNSIHFLFFFPIVVILYFLIPDKHKWKWLLVTSYYFYMSWNIKYVILIVISTVITYIAALLIDYTRRNLRLSEINKTRLNKFWVFLSFFINLWILFYFKYINFIIESINNLLANFNIHSSISMFDIILPVGISFYTFQALGYTIDVYRNDIKAEKNLFKYALFVSFFPQLVAGPIERSKTLLSQLDVPHKFEYNRIISGLKLMGIGLFKKIVIADVIAIYVNQVYNDVTSYTGMPLLIATFLFTIQIYCDFSGYTDIARGASRVIGIELMDNFRSPYLANSIRNFWKSWHISLSTWFRDYLYIPLGGNRGGKIKQYRNLLVTFLISGVWHGANWTFIIWGIIHGVVQIIEDIFRFNFKKYKLNIKGIDILKIVVTQLIVMFTWIFFRANTLNDAFYIIENMFVGLLNPVNYFYNGYIFFELSKLELLQFFIPIVILSVYDYFSLKSNLITELRKEKSFFRWLVYLLMVSFSLWYLIKFSSFSTQEFVYFQF